MKKIKLTQGQFALVDDEDFDWLNQWKWQARFDKKTNSFYAIRSDYIDSGGRCTILMHRQIMSTPVGMVVDHINHDTLNNSKLNLRNVSVSTNSKNRKGALRCSKTGILGVQPHGRGYRAHIRIGGKHTSFPVRDTIEEALLDRQFAEVEHYYK